MGAPDRSSTATAMSRLYLVPLPKKRTLGDLLHELAERPQGAVYIGAITQWVEYLLSSVPPTS